MDIMSIANMYTSMSAASLQTQVSVAMLDKAMETTETNASKLLETLDAGVASGPVGRNIDVYA